MPLFPTIGIPELLIILVIVLIFFGAGKLPEVGRALGGGLKAFKKAQREGDSVLRGELDADADIEEAQEVRSKSRAERDRR